jgi:hypothetical protein
MSGRWAWWIDGSDPDKQAAFNQLVAHYKLRRPIVRAGVVPGTPFRWQDLEDAGLAYLSRQRAFAAPNQKPALASWQSVGNRTFMLS